MVEKVIIRAVNIIRDKDMNNRLLLVLLYFKCPMLAVKDMGISQNLKSIKGELILSFRRLKDDVPFFNNFGKNSLPTDRLHCPCQLPK